MSYIGKKIHKRVMGEQNSNKNARVFGRNVYSIVERCHT